MTYVLAWLAMQCVACSRLNVLITMTTISRFTVELRAMNSRNLSDARLVVEQATLVKPTIFNLLTFGHSIVQS